MAVRSHPAAELADHDPHHQGGQRRGKEHAKAAAQLGSEAVQSESDRNAAENDREDQAAPPARFQAQARQQQLGDTGEDRQGWRKGQAALQQGAELLLSGKACLGQGP